MSITIKGVAQRTLATLTMATTVLGLAGFASITPVLAVAPADYGLKEGDTISASGSSDPDIYIVNDWGYKRLFVNPAIFTLYGHLSWAGVKAVSPATRDAFGTSGLFRNCETGDQKVYGLEVISEDVANLRWVNTTGAQAVADDANFFKKVFCINTAEMNLYGRGADYTSVTQVPAYTRGGSTQGPVAGFNPNGGTQGSIDTLELGSPAKTEALEGQSSVEIYAVDTKLTNDGPLLLQSADVWFGATDTLGDQKPWTYFTTVKLMVGGTVVATKNVSSATDWADVTDGQIDGATTTKEYRLRFTGLSALLPSNATTKVSVAVSVVNTIDSQDQDAIWNVELGDIRVLDESGLVVTENSGANATATLEDAFTVGGSKMAGVQVRDAADDISASVIKVSETSDTNNVNIYKFTIEETEGVAVDIDEMTLDFYAASPSGTAPTENNVIARARILEGSTQRGADEAVSSVGSASFTNMGIHLNADQKKEFTVQVDFKDNNAAARFAEGSTVYVKVDPETMVFTDANGYDEGDITEDVDATSNTHELRSKGISVALTSASISKTFSRDPAVGSSSDQATAYIKFAVTAFGTADMFVDKSAPLVQAALNDGESALGVTGTSVSAVATLTADNVITGDGTNGYKVASNGTRNFTITVVLTADDATSGVFTDASLLDLVYALTDVDGTVSYTFNLDNFKTNQVFLQSTP